MRVWLLTVFLALAPAPRAAAPRVPVLLELFTSEGCSSCPPADVLLSDLRSRQPVPGVEIIPIGEHVDYWDQLGWKDVASSHDATARQDAYARAFGSDNIYTPQAVIDGAFVAIGSDASAVRAAIQKAAARPHAQMAVKANLDGRTIAAEVTVQSMGPASSEPVQTVFALVEDDLTSAVRRGENRGRTLHHDAVVRSLRTVKSDGAVARASFAVDPGWNRAHLRLVAFLQGRHTSRVFATASTPPLGGGA